MTQFEFDKVVLEQELALDGYLKALLSHAGFDQIQEDLQEQTQRVTEDTLTRQEPEAAVPVIDPPVLESSHSRWAERFQCLILNAGSLKLVVPLDQLQSVIECDKRINKLPGQAAWFMGLYQTRNSNVKVVDLERLICADQKESRHYSFIMLFGQGNWGFGCDSVSAIHTVQKSQIRWQRSLFAPYLLGTVRDFMCPLLCPQELERALEDCSQ